MPDRAISAPLRRMTSPRGVISTRFRVSGACPGAIMARLNNPTPVVPAQRKPAGWVTINQVSDQADGGLKPMVRFERISRALETPPQLGDFKVFPEEIDAQPAGLQARVASQCRHASISERGESASRLPGNQTLGGQDLPGAAHGPVPNQRSRCYTASIPKRPSKRGCRLHSY